MRPAKSWFPTMRCVGLIRGPGLLCCVIVLALVIGLVGIARYRMQNRQRR